jgi:hypothetical protein
MIMNNGTYIPLKSTHITIWITPVVFLIPRFFQEIEKKSDHGFRLRQGEV